MNTLFYNAKVYTMADTTPTEAFLVSDKGIMLATGAISALKNAAGEGYRLVDLKDGAVFPAFIDSHSHITAYAQTLGAAQLTGSKDITDIKQRIREFAQENPVAGGQFIVAFGYDQNDLKEHRHPTRQDIDAACAEMPVIIAHASGHMGVLNSAALRQLNITKNTPDPSGGRIGRDASGEPTGYLEEAAFTAAGARVPKPDHAQRIRALARAQTEYIKRGILTIQDGLTRNTEWELLKAFADEGKLQADVVCYVDLKNSSKLLQTEYLSYQNHLRMGGYKIFLDGSPQGRTAWLTEPYENAQQIEGNAAYCGYPTYSDAEIWEFVELCCHRKIQLLAHCNGDAAAEQLIRICERARDSGLDVSTIRPVMIHAQLVRPDQLARMHACGIMASFFVAHTYYWGDAHIRNLGQMRARDISPAASALRAGVPFTFHQDTPVLPPDMLKTLWCAVIRRTRAGVLLNPDESIPLHVAWEVVTKTAAWQYGEEASKGTLTLGKKADFILLNRDPFTVPIEELPQLQVIGGWKEGIRVCR